MKFPSDHYPNSGIQHTRAVYALFMVTLFQEMYAPKKGTDIENHMLAIRKAVDACALLTKKKKLSQGAKRDIENANMTLAPYIDAELPRKRKAENIWCAIIWCALIFIEDVIATCPQYTVGKCLDKWKTLRSLVEELAEALFPVYPKLDEAGTMLYEMTAWALDGVVFPADDRLAA